MHVHVQCASGEAKFWLERTVELAQNWGLRSRQLKAARKLIEENENAFRAAWRQHFGD